MGPFCLGFGRIHIGHMTIGLGLLSESHSGFESLVGRVLIPNPVIRGCVMEASGMLWDNSKWNKSLTARLTIMIELAVMGC